MILGSLLHLTSCKNCGDDTSDLALYGFSFTLQNLSGQDLFFDVNSPYELNTINYGGSVDIIRPNYDSTSFILGGFYPSDVYYREYIVEFIPQDKDTIKIKGFNKEKCDKGFSVYFNDSLVCQDCGGETYILYK